MAKKSKKNPRYRERPGYERIPGTARQYRRTQSREAMGKYSGKRGEIVSRTQYIKETEGVQSLEAKAKMKRSERAKFGIRQPMRRYNAIVAQYKLMNGGHYEGEEPFELTIEDIREDRERLQYDRIIGGPKVRGRSQEARDFQKWVIAFRIPTKKSGFKTLRSWREARDLHLEAAYHLGIITSEERDQYSGEE